MNAIDWSEAGRVTVTVILVLGALWMYWQAVLFTADRLYVLDQEAQQRRDLELLYNAALAYIARRESQKAAIQEVPETAFMLDYTDDERIA